MDEPVKTDREKAIERVLSLANVTPESGATAGEVANAEALGRRLIEKHALRVDEVEAAARRLESEYTARLRGRPGGPDPYEHAPANPPPPAGGMSASDLFAEILRQQGFAAGQGFTFTTSETAASSNGGVFVRMTFGG